MNAEKIRPLSEQEYLSQAAPAHRRVFSGDDPFDLPFASGVQHRMILYPLYYRPEGELLEAIVEAAMGLGDKGFYFTVLERPPESEQDRPHHWFVPFSDIPSYLALGYPFVLENVIYSPSGSWGLMVSHENHGLLGGDDDFMSRVRGACPELNGQVESFLATWEDNKKRLHSRTQWVLPLLDHVYGEDRRRKLEAGRAL